MCQRTVFLVNSSALFTGNFAKQVDILEKKSQLVFSRNSRNSSHSFSFLPKSPTFAFTSASSFKETSCNVQVNKSQKYSHKYIWTPEVSVNNRRNMRVQIMHRLCYIQRYSTSNFPVQLNGMIM